MSRQIVVLISLLFLASLTWGQQPAPQGMPGMDMSGHDISHMQMQNKDMRMDSDKDADKDIDASAHAMHSMEGHMDMGPHMKMTALREVRQGDEERANQVAAAARKVAEHYEDYRVALADGFQIFLPNVPQKQYHFTNYGYGFEAAFHFNPDHPTSLLYEKHGDGYKLIGVMYTAAKRAGEDELDRRIPLSIAQWHAHINLCVPPEGQKREALGPHPRFGLHGSIATQQECEAAGGKFMPQIFGWMVHVYPFEQKPEDVWSVARQMHGHMD